MFFVRTDKLADDDGQTGQITLALAHAPGEINYKKHIALINSLNAAAILRHR